MAKTLTRLELFELIWSRPRSKLAAEFGISDVAIGKHCARVHVPGPPPGYWARVQAGKGRLRPPLPIRLPGHSRKVNDATLKAQDSPWRLVHCGLHLDSEKETVNFLELKNLCVHGEPMRVSPDLVYQNARSGEVILVEVKFSRQAIPSNLWPNIWAQLWVYAQIPVARTAPRVTVVGEIWGEWYARQERSRFMGLRASVRRDPRGRAYDRFFKALFNIYRGHSD